MVIDICNSLLLLSLSLALSSTLPIGILLVYSLFIGSLSQVPAKVTAKVTNLKCLLLILAYLTLEAIKES